jgi:hypothetical protein
VNNSEAYPKDTYVYPLTSNFREFLKNKKSYKLSQNSQTKNTKEITADDPFMQLWQRIIDIVFKVAQEFDQKWQKRRRIIDTMLIILFIFRLVFSKNKQGYAITIIELWDQCRKMNVPLPQSKPVAPSALCNARKKLDESIFKILNTEIINTYENTEDEYKWKNHRIFAVDGSKINLPRKLIACEYSTPSNNAHYPQGLVSCLYQLKSNIPYDFDLVSHNNERKCAISHMDALEQNDVVVYDRGYFSYIMLYYHIEQKKHAVFRIQKNTYKVIDDFIGSKETDKTVIIIPSKSTQRNIIAQDPDIQIIPLEIRLIKYTISETTYILGTTLIDKRYYNVQEFADVYHSRWGVEELYKISKVLIDVEDFHGETERGVKQELFAHFIFITLNRIFTNHAEKLINNEKEQSNERFEKESLKKFKINFKNSLITVARKLEGLFINQIKMVRETIQQIITAISSCKQTIRENRSYKRQSKKPIKKWRPRKSKKATV